jgi:sortase A
VGVTTWAVQTQNGGQFSEWVIPQDAAGWHVNSALPGHGSNVVLSGHHNVGAEVFRYVVDLEPGDAITLQADGRDYPYLVTDRFIVPERGAPEEQRRQNGQWIMATVDERLTLVTCWPYSDNSHRVIVIAKPAW